jgi:hypothetical protein
VKDFGNGSYSILLQVHLDFVGEFFWANVLKMEKRRERESEERR